MGIIKFFVQAAQFVVPVILVIFIIIEVFKTVSSGDVDTKKLSKSIITKIIAAVVVFLIFPISNLILSLFSYDNEYIECYKQAHVIIEESNVELI